MRRALSTSGLLQSKNPRRDDKNGIACWLGFKQVASPEEAPRGPSSGAYSAFNMEARTTATFLSQGSMTSGNQNSASHSTTTSSRIIGPRPVHAPDRTPGTNVRYATR